MRHLFSIRDLSTEEIQGLIDVAEAIRQDPAAYADVCRNKKLATLFFEPSTRTRLSFEAAMLDLGGSVLGFSDAGSSSSTKGETVRDTVHVVSLYADLIAMRHPKEGAPVAAALDSRVPIINAGDGGHNHPTQTLTDLYTIQKEKGSLDDLTIGLCGDLLFGRTVHSLVQALARHKGIHFVFISPHELAMPDYIKEDLEGLPNVSYSETEKLENVIHNLDVLYMTRVQKERFFNEADYIRLKDAYILTPAKLEFAKQDLAILHPLPRVNEIAVELDSDPRAAYFRQAENGKFIRMALILHMLEGGASDAN